MLEKLHLSESDKKILQDILSQYRDHFDFFAFGSRVKGNHKKYSDLDLAVIDKFHKGITSLKNSFEDSNLSITVDIVDLNMISEEFKNLIESNRIKL